MKWLFRTDCEANETVGTGHIKRSITFAQYVGKKQDEVAFLINRNNFARNLLRENEFSFFDADDGTDFEMDIKREDFNCVFVDLYDKYLDAEYMEFMHSLAQKVVIITDSCHREDILADRIIITNESMKGLLSYDKTKYLVGSQYIIMEDDFYENRITNVASDVNKILITFGGYDSYNVTCKVVKSLLDIQQYLKGTQVDVLCGVLYPYRREVEELLAGCFFANKIYQNVEDMCGFVSNYDYAITAGGNTFYELSAKAIPCSVITQTARQDVNCRALERSLKFNYIGLHHLVSHRDIAENVLAIIRDVDLRRQFNISNIKFFKSNAKELIYDFIIGEE